MELPIISSEFKRTSEQELTADTIKSAADLKRYLIENEIWSQRSQEKSGKDLEWDDWMVADLFQQYKGNERKFFISTYQNQMGQVMTRFETSINAVWANVYYEQPSGDKLHMIQDFGDWQNVTSGGIVRVEVWPDFKSKRDSSISGKIRPGEIDDPTITLYRKISEELRLEKSDYKITKTEVKGKKESYSFGFPGLWTRQEQIMAYDVRLNKNFKQQYDHVGKPMKIGNMVRTPVTVFKWEKM